MDNIINVDIQNFSIMPKWKKDETRFTVKVNAHETRGYQVNVPKPIMEILGEPESITFEVKETKSGNKIEIH